MSAYAESGASFRNRAKQIHLTDEHVRGLVDMDIRRFNHFAFAVSGQPGQLDPAKLQTILDSVCPAGASLGVQARFKQLAYESLTIAVAAIRQRVEHPEDAVKKLPAHEKEDRLTKIKAKITGFEISGDYEPAHCVIDAFAHMLEESTLKHFPLSKCVSREYELSSMKVDKQVFQLEGQQLQVKQVAPELSNEVSNELKVHQAFTRRGLALEMANLCTYAVHEKVTREFMSHLTRTRPPGFRKPGIDAILRADKELWTRVADRRRSDLRLDANGVYPVDAALNALYTSASGAFFLLPLPHAGSQSQPSTTPKRKAESDITEKHGPPPKAAFDRPAKKQNKNRSNAKKRFGGQSMPAGLHGFSGVNRERKRVCYNCNLPHGCSENCEKDGAFQKCSRGIHQCIKCFGHHPFKDCKN